MHCRFWLVAFAVSVTACGEDTPKPASGITIEDVATEPEPDAPVDRVVVDVTQDCEPGRFRGEGYTPTSYPVHLAPYPTRTSLSPEELTEYGLIGSGCIDLAAFYRLPGAQTLATGRLIDIADSITTTDDLEIVTAAMNVAHDQSYFPCTQPQRDALGYDTVWHNYPNEVLFSRTAEEILEGGCMTGCTDYALIFVAIARAKGIAATLVETIGETWLESMAHANSWRPGANGHFFSEVFVNGRWLVVDPAGRKITYRDEDGYYYVQEGAPQLLLDRGLDLFDFGGGSFDLFVQRIRDRFYISGP